MFLYSGKKIPGMYAVEVAGTLPDDIISICEDNGIIPKVIKKK